MKKRHLFRKMIFFLISFFIILYGGIFIYLKLSPKLEIKNANSVSLYDSSETLFFQGSEEKKWVSLDNISEYVKTATIYTEDKHFYKHNGFDILRIAKASLINIKSGKAVQGASTITQQYAKNLFLDFDKTWKRKWDELWYTLRIEDAYSKDDILEGYLNTINYGHGMYGIENASNYYFNKSSKDLDLAEASMLIGIPKSPSNYSPLINEVKAKERQLFILNNLVENNIITNEEKDAAYNKKLTYVGASSINDMDSVMYYQDAVLDELKGIVEVPRSFIETKGIKIYTNLNVDAQKKLESAVGNNISYDTDIQVSSVMMNPNTGGVLALVGGKDYNSSTYNRVISSKRQVGSTMKPFLYYAALENGFTSSSAFTSQKTTFTFQNREDYSPNNYNNVYGNKPISMATAIAYSENIYAVKTHLFLGEDTLVNFAKKLGITANLESVPSLPLGTNEISILEMAAGYSAFANLGYKVEPHLIEKIEDMDGNLLYQYKEKKIQILDSSLCFILNNMLTGTYDSSYIDYNYPTAISLGAKLTHKYALKSGTTEVDNWNIGFNKNILTAVWVGYDNNQVLKTSEYKYAQNIWYNAIEGFMENKGEAWYDVPKNVSLVLVDPISGRPVSDNAEKKKMMYFIKGTEPNISDKVFDEIKSNESAS